MHMAAGAVMPLLLPHPHAAQASLVLSGGSTSGGSQLAAACSTGPHPVAGSGSSFSASATYSERCQRVWRSLLQQQQQQQPMPQPAPGSAPREGHEGPAPAARLQHAHGADADDTHAAWSWVPAAERACLERQRVEEAWSACLTSGGTATAASGGKATAAGTSSCQLQLQPFSAAASGLGPGGHAPPLGSGAALHVSSTVLGLGAHSIVYAGEAGWLTGGARAAWQSCSHASV